MEELVRWTHNPACTALGRALLHSLWQGAALAGLLAANGRLGARARYGAACAALAALLISFGVTSLIGYDAPQSALMPPPISAVPSGDTLIPAGIARSGVDWIPWLVPLWTAGVMLMSLRLAVGWLGSRRLARLTGPPLPDRWQQAARALAATLRVKAPFRLLESARVSGPAVVGWLRPVILVPAGALVNLLESFAEVVLFYHPAAWWFLSRIRREREHCCDDLAVAVCGSALLYAEAVLRLEEARPARRALVFAARDGDLAARIRRLLQPRQGERPEWRAAFASLAGLLLVSAVVVSATAQQQAAPAPPRPSPAAQPQVAAPKAPAPDPELKRRVNYANERYREGSTPGSETERGRRYVRYGPPDEIIQHEDYEKWFFRQQLDQDREKTRAKVERARLQMELLVQQIRALEAESERLKAKQR